MTTKKVPLSGKPTAKVHDKKGIDQWVDSRNAEQSYKRLTIDIPVSLHSKLKADCAIRGKKMADEVRELLLQKYGKS